VTQAEVWKKSLEEADNFYAQGKVAFYKKDSTSAITFFQQAQVKYKNVLKEEVNVKTKEKTAKRLDKMTTMTANIRQ
jgi:hypothetical protein